MMCIIMSLTFVTAYINIYNNATPLDRTNSWRFDHFKKIAITGIQLCVFVGEDVYDDFIEITKQYSNVYVMPPVIWSELPIVQECAKYEGLKLPEIRHNEKDTAEYIMLQNSKSHFVQEAICENHWNSTHFAWIDFSIAYIFHNLKKSQEYLHYLSKRSWTKPFFSIPGCWGNKYNETVHSHFLNNIHWRFCGGFFIGDRSSMEGFVQEFHHQFNQYIETYKTLIWEVNIWAWMEGKGNWNPIWYKADHNDSILVLHPSVIAQPLIIDKECCVDLPKMNEYIPSSSSYVQDYVGRHTLNTRFVNYFLNPCGSYTFLDKTSIIKTRNVMSLLNNNEYSVEKSIEMKETTVGLPKLLDGYIAEGLEDIRLYNFQDGVRFIASTNNYSADSRIQMVVGNYLPERGEYSGCTIVEAPDLKSRQEKNWTPFVRTVQDDEKLLFRKTTVRKEEWFIYKWCPMELGKIVTNENGMRQLVIEERIETAHIPWFCRFRGSTPLVECEKGWVCVVHFSEEGSPRKYYHNFVWLDRITMKPIQYSDPFYFKQEGVEFCTGMKIHDEKTNCFVLWISQFDRDPLMVIGRPRIVHTIE